MPWVARLYDRMGWAKETKAKINPVARINRRLAAFMPWIAREHDWMRWTDISSVLINPVIRVNWIGGFRRQRPARNVYRRDKRKKWF